MEADGQQETCLAWMLGKGYANLDQSYLRDIKELIWCTYRSSFEQIEGTSFTSDAGWGCMIRTGQMIVAESLKRLQYPLNKIVGLFQDVNAASLSLHKIAALGQELGKEIGQWHTPSITALSLQYGKYRDIS
jgi:cysteine protease ATG4